MLKKVYPLTIKEVIMIKSKLRISIGCDHGGYELKEYIKDYLETKVSEVTDFGCYSDESVDYPDYAHKTCSNIEDNLSDLGILICGSGNGINMAANSHSGIRSALCWKPEIASLARQHNNANIMALPGRFIDVDTAIECVINFITKEYEGGRHEQRVNKIKEGL
jgi:ribose 5-phosphate isomerase B